MPEQIYVLCRRASDPLLPGNAYGWDCIECGKPLQVGPLGLEQIRKGGWPYCNDCGFTSYERLKAAGENYTLAISPTVKQQLKDR